MSRLESDTLKKLLHGILTTHAEELDCGGCYAQLEAFAEQELEGKNVDEAMPLVRMHLDRCEGCCQEYEALLDALKGIQAVP
jgi:hypothetical protein